MAGLPEIGKRGQPSDFQRARSEVSNCDSICRELRELQELIRIRFATLIGLIRRHSQDRAKVDYLQQEAEEALRAFEKKYCSAGDKNNGKHNEID